MTDLTMKIPDKAKKVFTGVIFDTYHWDQEMFDGSTAKFEMLGRPDASRIIATSDNKIILSQEKQPTCPEVTGTFGGRVDEGETPLECAKRELLEESGLESQDWELFSSHEPYPEKMDFTVYTYIARNCKKIKEPTKDPGEIIKTITVDFDKFIELTIAKDSPATKELIIDILKMKAEGTLEEFKETLFKK